VTQGAAGSVRTATWPAAHGVAAACVGLLLLAGTTLPTLTGTGPAFSVEATVPAGGPTADTDGSAGGRDRAPGNSPRSLTEGGQPPPTDRLDINRADADALQALPGVGRKTANVVLNVAFGLPTFPVDTHVFRVANRTGLAPGRTPLEVEAGLERRVPPAYREHAHHWLILHGRYVCVARKPLCGQCTVRRCCDLARAQSVAD